MKHIIITGASKGLGNALAHEMADGNTVLHLISRSNMEGLRDTLSRKGARVITYQFDLSRTDAMHVLTNQLFKDINLKVATWVVLINNAGLLEPIGPIGKYDTDDYRTNLEVNFVAPTLLCHEFIKQTASYTGMLRILNVSSGAAAKAYHGWSHYCATKAGIDMITQSIALEHAPRVGCVGYNPGRTDTNMQDTIRKMKEDDFANVDSFVKAWEDGNLNDPLLVARHMKDIILADDIEPGKIYRFG